MKKFHRFAVFRAQAPRQKRKAAADLLRGWLKDPRITGAEFDYFFEYEPGKKSARISKMRANNMNHAPKKSSAI